MSCKIFVVIPLYNNEKLIKESVESVISQPYKNIEVIIVNDGSTDNSYETAIDLSKKYNNITVLNQLNQGVSVARNLGLEYAISNSSNMNDYVAFLDSDDFWNHDIINDQYIDSLKNEDIIANSSLKCDFNGGGIEQYHSYEKENRVLTLGTTEYLLHGHLGAHLFNIKLFKSYDIRFISGIRNNEDIMFLRQLLLISRSICFKEDFLYVYRKNPLSVTHTQIIDEKNAFRISNYWKTAAKSSACLKEQFLQDKWKNICKISQLAIQLEEIRLLAENGYNKKNIELMMENNEVDLKLLISNIEKENLAKWQQKDYELIEKNFELYCLKYFLIGKIKKIFKILKNILVN